ncbi:hypothetical protein E0J16_34080 [Rhizobium pisi]|uniref:hypothetical protein n=1 Tax=Rhizobium pisi TaxID=574561 RepID=UPI00103B7E66|nr:hypothetical protein [Rhizobium pisi]TCA41719.1 hypothetical protein E0J16_34080 [Rhizobium pisi]
MIGLRGFIHGNLIGGNDQPLYVESCPNGWIDQQPWRKLTAVLASQFDGDQAESPMSDNNLRRPFRQTMTEPGVGLAEALIVGFGGMIEVECSQIRGRLVGTPYGGLLITT